MASETGFGSPARSLSSTDSASERELLTEVPSDPDQTVIAGFLKFRDYKRWKSRFGVLTKISPAADCLHLQLYRDSKDRYKQGQTKASLSLQHFLGIESGFTLDKESNTIAILCQDVTVVLAFDTRERLIQWQVKIANNLGEDQQYLIQIASAPPRTKITPGPARIHVREYRFCLTMGVPPRLMGVWDIRQLRRYGVVDHRFCFEGGSSCGRWEGLYVLVTDQGEDITRTFKLASEGKLSVRRKAVSRNMSVMESPRRTLQQRKSNQIDLSNGVIVESTNAHGKQNSESRTIWESTETTCDYGDTASVNESVDAQECIGWAPDIGIGRCASCISKLGTLSRSSTMVQTPSAGFSPSWIVEETTRQLAKEGSSVCNTSVISGGSGTESHFTPTSDNTNGCDCRMIQQCCCQSKIGGKPSSECCSGFVAQYENYDVPKTICRKLQEEIKKCAIEPNKTADMSTQEYYDTPKKIKDQLHKQRQDAATVSNGSEMRHCFCPKHHSTIRQFGSSNTCAHSNIKQGPNSAVLVDRQLVNTDLQGKSYTANGAIYAKVDLMKKTKKKTASLGETGVAQDETREAIIQVNYENLEFAQSLEHYENVKDLAVRLQNLLGSKTCNKCPCNSAQDDYLIMGPVGDIENKGEMKNVVSYIPMTPVLDKSSPTKCNYSMCCFKEHLEAMMRPKETPESDQSKSASASPFLRRHDVSSCYATSDGRRLASLRRRSNSVDSGRYFDGLECISERTASSTHNTITANSATASVDSLPSETTDEGAKLVKEETSVRKTSLSPAGPPVDDMTFAISRRPPVISCKTINTNRDSSSSNDSGVSTGSLKHCGAEFMEFETLITPLSKVRHHSLGNKEFFLSPPRRSKSSDPLQDLSFQFDKQNINPKSSSAEAEVPVSFTKKETNKDLSVSSSSGGLTIPYMDSISTSSGTSDMSDYFDTLSLSSYSSSEAADNLRLCHSAVTILRPRSGKEYQKIDRYNIDDVKNTQKASGTDNSDSPSLGYISSTSSN